jgi:hypothetical protein
MSLGHLLASRVGPRDSVRDALEGVTQALRDTESLLSASMASLCAAVGGTVMVASLTSLARGDASGTGSGSAHTAERRGVSHSRAVQPSGAAADASARIGSAELAGGAAWLVPLRDSASLIARALEGSPAASACLVGFAAGATASLTAMESAVTAAQSKSQDALSWLSDSKSDSQSAPGETPSDSEPGSLVAAWETLRNSIAAVPCNA